jgi:hypothetical protein
MRRLGATCASVSSLTAAAALCVANTLVLIGLLSATAVAVMRMWDGWSEADSTTDANWSSNIEPASDSAEFERGAAFDHTVGFPYLLPFGGDITADRLIVGSNTVSFDPICRGADYLLDNTTTIEAVSIRQMPARGVTIGSQANDTASVLRRLDYELFERSRT